MQKNDCRFTTRFARLIALYAIRISRFHSVSCYIEDDDFKHRACYVFSTKTPCDGSRIPIPLKSIVKLINAGNNVERLTWVNIQSVLWVTLKPLIRRLEPRWIAREYNYTFQCESLYLNSSSATEWIEIPPVVGVRVYRTYSIHIYRSP